MIIEEILKEAENRKESKYETLYRYISSLHKVYMNEIIKPSGRTDEELKEDAWRLYRERRT